MNFKYNQDTSIPIAFELQMDINHHVHSSNFHNDEGEQFKHLQMNADYINKNIDETPKNNNVSKYNNDQSKLDCVRDSTYF